VTRVLVTHPSADRTIAGARTQRPATGAIVLMSDTRTNTQAWDLSTTAVDTNYPLTDKAKRTSMNDFRREHAQARIADRSRRVDERHDAYERSKLPTLTKHVFRAARRRGQPIGWSEARKRAQAGLNLQALIAR